MKLKSDDIEGMLEDRLVVYAPTGKDAKLITQVLGRSGIDSIVCTRAADVAEQLKEGAGALLLVDEVLDPPLMRLLAHYFGEQPSWSDLPVLVMSTRGVDSAARRSTYLQLGNVTLLERPLQSVTLVSAATAALRARQRQYAMREIDRRKDEFLAMLAHELRNPLAPISAASDLLKLPGLAHEKIRQTSNIISRQVRHMTGMIDDLLDVSRVSRGLVSLDMAVVDARQIVTSAVEQGRPMIEARRHRLTVQMPPESAYIQGDQKRLVQILANVLNNASKYTPEGGEIVLSMDVAEADLKFLVRDNGIGIEDDVIGHIFEMFTQAERTSDRTQGGLGIGLALVKNLVQLHGGSVVARSDGPGKGSLFEISFPRSFPPNDVSSTVIDVASRASVDRTVLLVDDNVDAAMMLGMFLEMDGYKVHTVNNAGAAIRIAMESANMIDACLLDIGLPDMDGNDLARRLRSISSTSNAMLVAITGYGQESDRRKTQDAGFDHHFVKPVDMQELTNILASSL